jgi:uncharacterized protein YukE
MEVDAMAGMTGMDIEQVRVLSKQLSAAADQVRQIASDLSSKLGSTTWVGNDQTRFTSDWNSTHRPNLSNVADALTQASTQANKNATEQEQASS